MLSLFETPQGVVISDEQNCFHSSSVIRIPQKSITCPSGKLKREFTSPELLDTTFFARCTPNKSYSKILGIISKKKQNHLIYSVSWDNTTTWSEDLDLQIGLWDIDL